MTECVIQFDDEVNCKLLNLDVATRRHLVKKLKFQVPYARHLPSVRLGRWDGCKEFFTLAGSSFINLLPEIIPELESFGYDVVLDDRRQYSNSFSFPVIAKNSYSHIVWPDKHPMAGQPVELHDHQAEVINCFLQNPQGLQEVATSAGKTVITAILSHVCEAYGRTLVIVPSKSLVIQTEKDYKLFGLDVGVYFGDRKEAGRKHTICTWQSLNNILKNTKEGKGDITIGDFVEDVCAIIVDEVHAAKAEVLKQLLTGVLACVPMRWGLTGTIPKDDFDFYAIKVSIGDVINRVSTAELQDKGLVAQLNVHVLQLMEYVEYKDYQSELKYLVTTDSRMKFLANTIQEISKSGNILVLIDRIETGKLLQEYLPDGVFISGSTKTTTRAEHYSDISESDNVITIATYGVAAVGINIPRLFHVMLLEPGKSFVRVIQSIGRGIRIAQDKNHVDVWDVTSTCKFSKRHLTKRKQFYKEQQFPFEIVKVDWQSGTPTFDFAPRR